MTIANESYNEFRERLNFEDDVRIDGDALDVEFVRQPQLVWVYGEELALAREDMDRALDAVEIIYSELDARIRQDPEAMGVPLSGKTAAPTEAGIKAAIWQFAEYQDARDAYHNSRLRYNLLTNAHQSVTAKGEALAHLVKLVLADYFAAPAQARNLTVELNKKLEKNGRKSFDKSMAESLSEDTEAVVRKAERDSVPKNSGPCDMLKQGVQKQQRRNK